jgi:molecular chaperone GrpE
MSKKSTHEEPQAENMAEQPDVNLTNGQEDIIAEEQVIAEETQQEQANFEAIVNELNLKVSDLNDKHLRLSAEFDNYRKRTLKEKMELTKTGGENVLKAVLPVVDDFERAMAHIDEAKDIQALKDGVLLIYNKFKDFLASQGVKEIETNEKEFDTDLHEAITKIPAPTEDMKGKVIDCVEKGFVLNDKVIRFSKVVVGI